MQGHQIVKIVFLVVTLAFVTFATCNVTHYYGCWGQKETVSDGSPEPAQ